MRKINDRVGEAYTTNEGYTIKIVKYFSARNCTIQFEDGITITNRQYIDIKRGRIKNPFHKSVFDVGYFGVGKYSWKTHTKIYNTWIGVLERCHSNKYQEKRPTYIGCIVSEEWYNFHNFAEWADKNYNPKTMQGWHLDKDILIKDNKAYSPETCCFVPNEINVLFTKRQNYRGECPIGVSKFGDKFRADLTISNKKVYLGLFSTPEEAFQVYKTAKETHIKQTAEKYKNKISEKTYQALINYKVEITD